MPPIHALQPSFAGGEFAPSLYARVDLQKYSSGARTLRNFLVHPHGGASNRPGTKFVAFAKYANKKARVVAFEFSTTQAYVIEFGDKYCRFYANDGQIQASAPAAYNGATTYAVGDMVTYSGVKYICIQAGVGHQPDISPTFWTAQTIYEIATPYAEADLATLKFAQSADTLYICHPSYAPRVLQRFANDSWILSVYANTRGPFMLSNTSTVTITPSGVYGAINLTASSSLFSALHVNSFWRVNHSVPGNALTFGFGATGASASIQCGTNWRVISHGTWTGKFRIEQSIDNGGTWTEIRSFSGANDFNVNTFGAIGDYALIRLNCYSYTSGTINVDLTSDPFDRIGIVKITGVTNSTLAAGTVIDQLGGTSATSVWAEGSWSDYRGYPSCCTFFQDRLVFASTPTEPQTAWFTETGNYTSFARNVPLVDSDGITVTLPSRKVNAVRSLLSLQEILAMTSASEWSIGPGTAGTITPTSINAQIQGYRGCNTADPVIIGNRVIYVQPMGSVVRDIGADFTVSGFTGTNLSILSNHLFTNFSITEMAYQQEPDSIVWCVRSDGALLSMTYLLEHQVIAWTRHDTNGSFQSVCTIPSTGFNEVWFLVLRNGQRYIERMVPRLVSTDPRDQFFVDCGISYDSPILISGATQANPVVITATAHGFSNGQKVDIRNIVGPGNNAAIDLNGSPIPATNGMDSLNSRRFIVANATANTFELKDTDGVNVNGTALTSYVSGGEVRATATAIGGLSHLNGLTVKVLADGNVQSDKVVSGGSITLDTDASIVHIGLGYVSDLETLNIEVPQQNGTMQGRKVRSARVIVRFLNSKGGSLGPDSDHLNPVIQRSGEPMGSPIALQSADYSDVIDASVENGGRIFFRQSDPLPVTILAVMPILTVGEN